MTSPYLTIENYRSSRYDIETVAQIGSDKRYFLVALMKNNTKGEKRIISIITEEYQLPDEYTVDDAHEHLLCEVIDMRQHESIDSAMRYASGEVTRSILAKD